MVDPNGRLEGRGTTRSKRLILVAALIVLFILFFLPGGVLFSPLITILMFVGVALQKRSASTSRKERRRLALVALTLSLLGLFIVAFWLSALSVGEPKTDLQFKELPSSQLGSRSLSPSA